jgi:hypothetical protein
MPGTGAVQDECAPATNTRFPAATVRAYSCLRAPTCGGPTWPQGGFGVERSQVHALADARGGGRKSQRRVAGAPSPRRTCGTSCAWPTPRTPAPPPSPRKGVALSLLTYTVSHFNRERKRRGKEGGKGWAVRVGDRARERRNPQSTNLSTNEIGLNLRNSPREERET